jgi:HlyD family secretion protein
VRAAPVVDATAAPLVAAAPGWVDVEGGTRQLGMALDGVVAAVAAAGDTPLEAGTELVRLDDAALQLDLQTNALETRRLQQAERNREAQHQQAQEEVSRLVRLVRVQAEPADMLRQAEAQARLLDDALQSARLDLAAADLRRKTLALQADQHRLRAPVRGRVLRMDAHVGEVLAHGAPAVWFAPDAPLVVRAELDERLFSKVKIGLSAEVEAEGGDGRVYPARLLSIARQVGPVRALPEVSAAPADDRVVECVLALGDAPLLIGQRVIVRMRDLR